MIDGSPLISLFSLFSLPSLLPLVALHPLVALSEGTVPFAVSEATVSLALDVLAGVLGLAVGAVAYRAYRRNESLPMLFVAAGFLLTFWTPVFLDGALALVRLAFEVTPRMDAALGFAVPAAGRVSEVVGLLALLYGLAMPVRR